LTQAAFEIILNKVGLSLGTPTALGKISKYFQRSAKESFMTYRAS
jgi:hypothetical protein